MLSRRTFESKLRPPGSSLKIVGIGPVRSRDYPIQDRMVEIERINGNTLRDVLSHAGNMGPGIGGGDDGLDGFSWKAALGFGDDLGCIF